MSTKGVTDHAAPATGDNREAEPSNAPHLPTDLDAASWRYIVLRTIKEFRRDACIDHSAALAFRSTLAVFPVLLVIVSVLGLLGETNRFTNFIVNTVSDLGSTKTADSVRALFDALSQAPAAYACALGIVLTLWSTSGYVSAFGRTMNHIYGFREGRVAWRLRLSFVPLAAFLVIIVLASAAALLVGGSVAEAVGRELGLPDALVFAWNIVRIPLVLILAVLAIALLYYFTPNVRHQRIRWMSVGAFAALLVWIVSSAGLLLYFANFSSFDRSYGAIGGGIVFLSWLWLTNIALLVGGEFDAELERMRQLHLGRDAESHLRLPMRETKMAITNINAELQDTIAAREIRDAARESAAESEAKSESEVPTDTPR